jgi:tetratricopeptide (TPR) repeat protein
LACWDNALEIRIQILGHQHLDVANTYNNRGIALGKLGLWQAAVTSLESALTIRKFVLGMEDSQVAATMHNLANVHHQAGDLQGAIRLLAQSKGIYHQHIQKMSPQPQQTFKSQEQLARANVAMGHVYWEARQFGDAANAYLDALHIYKQLGVSETDHHVQEIRQDLQQLQPLMARLGPSQSPPQMMMHEAPTFQTTILAPQQAA